MSRKGRHIINLPWSNITLQYAALLGNSNASFRSGVPLAKLRQRVREPRKSQKDTLLLLVVGEDVLNLGHDGALHGFDLPTQVSELPLLATQEHQQLVLHFGIHLRVEGRSFSDKVLMRHINYLIISSALIKVGNDSITHCCCFFM